MIFQIIKTYTKRFTDLDKLNLVILADGGKVRGLSRLSLLPQLHQKMTLTSKSGQKSLENNHLNFLVYVLSLSIWRNLWTTLWVSNKLRADFFLLFIVLKFLSRQEVSEEYDTWWVTTYFYRKLISRKKKYAEDATMF